MRASRAVWRGALLWHVAAIGALAGGDAAAQAGAASREQVRAAPARPRLDLSLGADAHKSYAIPAAEIVGFQALLNVFDRTVLGGHEYDANLSSIRRNLGRGWAIEDDPYEINQLGHPYQGAMYHGFARSAGLSYWESAAYTFAGSALWEIAGETTRPSRNDQVASGIAGSFLGEPLHRMAQLLLERERGLSTFWRETAAAAISPPTGFNRLAFGERFDALFDSRNPATFAHLHVGTGSTVQDTPDGVDLERHEVLGDFAMDYGLPGKAGYAYRRPFDYFHFQAVGSTANGVESVLTRGLLLGTRYQVGKRHHGIWGLYGTFDYFQPQLFRVSSTGLSLGTTAQWRLSDALVLQSTALAGVGFAAARTRLATAQGRDYHYGVGPQGLLALRLIVGDRAALSVSARDYFVTELGGDHDGQENIARADVSFTVRVHRGHAMSLRYLWTRRDVLSPDLGDSNQSQGLVGIFYTYLWGENFGVVD
jgi:hypothetical protein